MSTKISVCLIFFTIGTIVGVLIMSLFASNSYRKGRDDEREIQSIIEKNKGVKNNV